MIRGVESKTLETDAQREALMRQTQFYQIARDCRLLLKFGEMARHPMIRAASAAAPEDQERYLRSDVVEDEVERTSEDFVRAIKQEKLETCGDVQDLIGKKKRLKLHVARARATRFCNARLAKRVFARWAVCVGQNLGSSTDEDSAAYACSGSGSDF
jgi:hypothetical protein